ncbi:MAG: hypothetical protein ABSF52_18830 [Syntrophobacteraceae bacterium]
MSQHFVKCHIAPQDGREDSYLKDVILHLSGLSYDQMEEWLRAVLRGSDTLIPDRGEISRARLVDSIYPLLPRTVKEDLLKASNGLLRDLLQNGVWTDVAADELLLLIQYLAPDDSCGILEAVAKGELFRNLGEHLRFSLIQTLLSLGINMPPDFWYCLLAEDPSRFGGLVFDGLSRIALDLAIQILPSLPDDDEVAELIGCALPGLVKETGPGGLRRVGELISAILLQIPSAVRREIQEYFVLEGFPLGPSGQHFCTITHEDLEKALWTLSPYAYVCNSQPIPAPL